MPPETPDCHIADNRPPEPLVIPRSAHSISRNNIDREALKVMYRLRDAGFSAYLVGGGVRDLYMGRTPKDFDISTDARPGQLRKLFRNSRIIGKRFRLVQVLFRGTKVVEVSTLRSQGEYDLEGRDQVLAANNTFGTLAEDAFRRDLTINSLFYEIENFTILDYTGGVDDINNRIIRIVGDPQRRIVRDPVRIMRAVRHAARAGFSIEKSTWAAILEHMDKLRLCPESRIRDELLKDLRGGASNAWFRLAAECGLLGEIMPCYRGKTLDESPMMNDLGRLLSIVDRLAGQEVFLPDHILLALFLAPWATHELHLLEAPTKGEEGFNFSRSLRDGLRNNLAHLNIKRAMQETITTLLVSLPLLNQFDNNGKWPKKISRKHYFTESLQFYRLITETQTDETAPQIHFQKPVKDDEKSREKNRSSHRSDRLPAFANNTKGGVFGFKK